MSRCKAFAWDYMITLKRGSLKSVWEEFDGLRKCEPENTLNNTTGLGRTQTFNWSNEIEYIYGKNNKKLRLNLVTCREEWVERRPRSGGKPEHKVCEFAWLSSMKVTAKNVLKLCNDIARKRWSIENHFHVEKHQGYNYSHCYSYNWNAMKSYHSLMKFGHFINTMILGSEITCGYVAALGSRWFIKKVWDVLKHKGIGQENAEILQYNRQRKKRGCVFRVIKPMAA